MTTSGPDRSSTNHAQDSFPGTDGQGCSSSRTNADDLGEISRQMLSRLSQTIQGDIIPRLMLAFDSSGVPKAAVPQISEQLNNSVDEFVHLLLAHDATVATNYVSALRSDGIPLSALYLDLLSPAARRLGVMWEQDECSFTDVTIGVCRMHQVLLEFSRCFDAVKTPTDRGRSVLIVPVPGEQHTFGLFMVIEFLRRAGFSCVTGSPASGRQFEQLARKHDFDVIGISVSEDRHVETVAELIARLRRRASDTVIMVGGRVFVESPELARKVGADTTAADGREAVHEINRICRNRNGKSAN